MNKKERAAYRRGLTDGARFVIEHERLHRVVAQALADLKDTGMAIIDPREANGVGGIGKSQEVKLEPTDFRGLPTFKRRKSDRS